MKRLFCGVAATVALLIGSFGSASAATPTADPTYTMQANSLAPIQINSDCQKAYDATANRTIKECVTLWYYSQYGIPSNTSTVTLYGGASATCYVGQGTAGTKVACDSTVLDVRSHWLDRNSTTTSWKCGGTQPDCSTNGQAFNNSEVFLDQQQMLPETQAYCSDPTHAAVLNNTIKSNGFVWTPATDHTPDINLCYPGAPSAN